MNHGFKLHPDGTLEITMPKGKKVTRVLVCESGTQNGSLYYPERDVPDINDRDMISRQAAIDLVKDVCDAIMSGCESWYDPETEDEVYKDIREVDAILKCNKEVRIALRNMPSAQPEEVIPHRNYKYLSDYWCACGWHLGKKGDVKYCADCGRKVNWDE